MRIEILEGSEDPVIFQLNSARMTIGSSKTCDIVIKSEGVSRKHLIIITEDEKYFVIDQGSTNGSFINEERLTPGRQFEFTSFFPVRLGNNVLISLLNEDEYIQSRTVEKARQTGDQTDLTKFITLNKAETESLIKKHEENRAEIKKRGLHKAPEKKSTNYTQILGVLILLAAVYYNFYVKEPVVEEKISKVGETVLEKPMPKVDAPTWTLSPDELTTHDNLATLIKDMKCITEMEKYLCLLLPDAKNSDGKWGVTQVGTMLNVMIDGTKYLEQAKTIVEIKPSDREESKVMYEKHIKEVVALLFLLNGVPKTIDFELLKFLKLTIAFYTVVEEGPKLYSSLSIKPEALQELNKIMTPAYLNSVRQPGTDVSLILNSFYIVR